MARPLPATPPPQSPLYGLAISGGTFFVASHIRRNWMFFGIKRQLGNEGLGRGSVTFILLNFSNY